MNDSEYNLLLEKVESKINELHDYVGQVIFDNFPMINHFAIANHYLYNDEDMYYEAGLSAVNGKTINDLHSDSAYDVSFFEYDIYEEDFDDMELDLSYEDFKQFAVIALKLSKMVIDSGKEELYEWSRE